MIDIYFNCNNDGYSSTDFITNNILKISNLKKLLLPLLKQYLNKTNINTHSCKNIIINI